MKVGTSIGQGLWSNFKTPQKLTPAFLRGQTWTSTYGTTPLNWCYFTPRIKRRKSKRSDQLLHYTLCMVKRSSNRDIRALNRPLQVGYPSSTEFSVWSSIGPIRLYLFYLLQSRSKLRRGPVFIEQLKISNRSSSSGPKSGT